MKVARMVFSLTGNTMLAARRAERLLAGCEFAEAAPDGGPIDLSGFDGALLASPVLYRDLPEPFAERIASVAAVSGKPALLVATYGMMAGRALERMAALARSSGFRVAAAVALPMPESYPPFRSKGWTDDAAPSASSLALFDAAVDRFRLALEGRAFTEPGFRPGFFDLLVRPPARKARLRGMGALSVDATRSACGACRLVCPVGAIRGADLPSFDAESCLACYACYNACPSAAIEAEGSRGRDARYKPDSTEIRARMAAGISSPPAAPGGRARRS